jgi:hypothetical protein
MNDRHYSQETLEESPLLRPWLIAQFRVQLVQEFAFLSEMRAVW